jgi:hypothetical protein
MHTSVHDTPPGKHDNHRTLGPKPSCPLFRFGSGFGLGTLAKAPGDLEVCMTRVNGPKPRRHTGEAPRRPALPSGFYDPCVGNGAPLASCVGKKPTPAGTG